MHNCTCLSEDYIQNSISVVPFLKRSSNIKVTSLFFFGGGLWKKNECCAVIQYLKIKGWNPKVFHKDMSETHGENAPSHTIVKDSHQNFKEEETAFNKPVSWKTCKHHEPRNDCQKLTLWLTGDWLPGSKPLLWASYTQAFFTFWPKNWLWGKHQRDGSPNVWLMLKACRIQHLCQYVSIWRRFSWLTEQIFA